MKIFINYARLGEPDDKEGYTVWQDITAFLASIAAGFSFKSARVGEEWEAEPKDDAEQ